MPSSRKARNRRGRARVPAFGRHVLDIVTGSDDSTIGKRAHRPTEPDAGASAVTVLTILYQPPPGGRRIDAIPPVVASLTCPVTLDVCSDWSVWVSDLRGKQPPCQSLSPTFKPWPVQP